MSINFPYIKYVQGLSFKQWGQQHGEEFRDSILELAKIRRELMILKNPALSSRIDELAKTQFYATQMYSKHLSEELEGLSQGSGLSISDIVVLNNYTDFRDIILPDEGCSCLYIKTDKNSLGGQTWDMHKSAKNYVCLLHIPKTPHSPEMICFSLVGCVGMMGINTHNIMVGVNNINTENAKAALIWPALVRVALASEETEFAKTCLMNAPVTSGHNYLLASENEGYHLEIAPTIKEVAAHLKDTGHIIHTNHCLNPSLVKIEQQLAQNSTSHIRYELLHNKVTQIKNLSHLRNLLGDHENYPKSICSHFQSGAQDPSATCGGGIGDFSSKEYTFWKGCKIEDSDYKEYHFELKDGSFKQINQLGQL